MPEPTLTVPALAAAAAANVGLSLLAQAGPGSPMAGYEPLLKLVPELAIAVALFFVVKYFMSMFKGQQDRFDLVRVADNDRRDRLMTETMSEFRIALHETNERSARQSTEIVAELRSSSMLAREQNEKQFTAMIGLTRESVANYASLREVVTGLQADIRELKSEDRRRSALPPPGGGEFRVRGRRDDEDPRDPRPA